MKEIFFQPGDVVEVRALGKVRNQVLSGYFKDFNKLEENIIKLDQTGLYKGIYFILNKINPTLYARQADSLSRPGEKIAATTDQDIIRRYWLPIDLDPVRPSDISSTDEEHNASMERAGEVREHLKSIGWPDPIFADSGNGAHLLYKIDFPNDKKSMDYVEKCLKALDSMFSDEKIKIDVTNSNAARIWKAYGTIARKGSNVPERPWRRSRILEVPNELRCVPEELIASLGWQFQQTDHAERFAEKRHDKIDVEQWLAANGLDVAKRKTTSSGADMFVLDQCPWNPDHTDLSAWIAQFPSGAIAAGCHHNSCMGKDWRALRALYEPVRSDPEQCTAPIEPIENKKLIAGDMQLEEVADIEYDDNGNIKDVTFNPDKAADAICKHMHILATPDKKLWVYDSGYYRSDGETIIEQCFDRVAGNYYSINRSKEALKKIYLRTLVPFEELDKDPYLMCCKNGVVDLRNGKFLEHGPSYRMTLPCNVTYDPKAKADNFISFLNNSVSNETDRQTLIDWIVACCCLTEFEFILFLTGHGGNGKHVYEAVLQAFFGSEATEAIGLDELTSSRFAIGNLARARLCISTETNPDRAKTEMAKKISGNDWLSSDVKNSQIRKRFKAFTQLLWDSNSMPSFDDNSAGFKRRFTRVNMPYQFVDQPDPSDALQKKKDPLLLEKIVTTEELSGILNLVLERSPKICLDRKIERRENDFDEYEKQSMSFSDFVERFIEFVPEMRDLEDYCLSGDYLYSKFQEFNRCVVGSPIKRKQFSSLMGKFNGESSRTIRVLGMPVRGFRGLKFDETVFKAFIESRLAIYSTNSYSSFSLEEKKITEEGVIGDDKKCNDSCNDSVTILFDSSNGCNDCNALFDSGAHEKHDILVKEERSLRSLQGESLQNIENQQQENLSSEVDKSSVTIPNRYKAIRGLKRIEKFIGIDGISYGPIEPEDVVNMPEIHAQGLISKGYAIEIHENNVNCIETPKNTETPLKTIDSNDKIKVACRMELAMTGWIDAKKIALNLKRDIKDIEEWLEANGMKNESGRWMV